MFKPWKRSLKKLLHIIAKFTGPVLFIIILSKLDLSALRVAFAKAGIIYVGLGLMGSVLIPVLRSARWNLINRNLGVNMRFMDTVRAQFVGNAFALFVPTRIGLELYRFLFARNLGHPSGLIVLGLILDRFYDVFLITLIFLGGFFNLKIGSDTITAGVFGAVFFVAIIFLIYITCAPNNKLVVQIMARLKPKSLHRLQKGGEEFGGNPFLFGASRSGVLGFFGYSMLLIIIDTVRVDFFAKSLGIDIGFVFMLWCVSAVVVCNNLPISYMGLGTRDLTLAYLLSFQGVGPEEAVYISTMILAGLLVPALIGAIIYIFTSSSENVLEDSLDEHIG